MTNFEVVKHNRDGRQLAIYLCRRCSRAWQLPRPCDPWRLKALVAHADAHNAALSRALAEASEELETPRAEKEVDGQS